MLIRLSAYFLVLFFAVTVCHADTTTGLVGWWKLNEGTGLTTIDSSGRGNTGTLQNSPTWVNGIRGKALSFDGVSQYVSAGADTLPSGSASRTLSGWIYITQYANYNIGFDYGGGGGGAVFGFYLNGSTLNFWGNGNDINTGYTINLNQWYNIVITYDGTNVGMYVNGAEILTPTPPPAPLNTGTSGMLIGRSYNGDQYPGLVDDVRVYNRVLTASDVYALYLSDNKIRNVVMNNVQFK